MIYCGCKIFTFIHLYLKIALIQFCLRLVIKSPGVLQISDVKFLTETALMVVLNLSSIYDVPSI